MKTWISSYSPAQGELENLCFTAVDPRIWKLGVFVCHVEAIVRDQFFFTNFSFVCSEEGSVKKKLTQ